MKHKMDVTELLEAGEVNGNTRMFRGSTTAKSNGSIIGSELQKKFVWKLLNLLSLLVGL